MCNVYGNVAGLGRCCVSPDAPAGAFSDSELDEEVTIESPGHLVLFSPVREVNNEIRSATMARLPVKGVGQLYQIQRGANREEARDHYLRQLQTRGAQILFECSGRSCGRSNVWANQIFDQSKLYGRDSNQDYVVAGSIDENGQPWLTLVYTVTRGNQREYVWVEQLVSPGAPRFRASVTRVRESAGRS